MHNTNVNVDVMLKSFKTTNCTTKSKFSTRNEFKSNIL